MSVKEDVLNHVIDIEGGYVDDPSDSGGETKYGVTSKVARAYGYTGDMKDLKRAKAFDIYDNRYWKAIDGDTLADLSAPLVREVFDTAINAGVGRAIMFLQRVLNVFNRGGKLYADINVDGVTGPATMNALNHFLIHHDEYLLLRALNCLQGSFYIELAERREKDERFIKGWLAHRVVV